MNKCENNGVCFVFFLCQIFKINFPKGMGKSFKFAYVVEI